MAIKCPDLFHDLCGCGLHNDEQIKKYPNLVKSIDSIFEERKAWKADAPIRNGHPPLLENFNNADIEKAMLIHSDIPEWVCCFVTKEE